MRYFGQGTAGLSWAGGKHWESVCFLNFQKCPGGAWRVGGKQAGPGIGRNSGKGWTGLIWETWRVVVTGCWKFESYCRGAGDGLDFLWSYETGHQFGRGCPQENVFSRQPYLLPTLICQSESSRWRSTVRRRASCALIQTCWQCCRWCCTDRTVGKFRLILGEQKWLITEGDLEGGGICGGGGEWVMSIFDPW